MFVKLVLVKHVADLSGNLTHSVGSLLNGLLCGFCHKNDFPGGSVGKSVCNTGDRVRSLGKEDALEKEMATYSSILAWRIPWREELGGLHAMGLQRVGHN